jgi:hypothetical protein
MTIVGQMGRGARSDEEGQDVAEYAVMLAVILIIVIITISARRLTQATCSRPQVAPFRERRGPSPEWRESGLVAKGVKEHVQSKRNRRRQIYLPFAMSAAGNLSGH